MMPKRVSESVSRRVSWSVLLLAAGILACAALAQKFPWQDTPEAGGKTPQTVKFEGPDQIDIAASKPQVVELRFRIQDGFHINSHAPHEKTLIPTQLMVVDGDGVNVSAVDFPPGTDTSFAFAPNQKVSVYTGMVTLHAHMTVASGNHLLQGALRYQACDANACFPPRKIPIAVSLLAK
jgi:cytochrome c biogenesis DsbD-like protein